MIQTTKCSETKKFPFHSCPPSTQFLSSQSFKMHTQANTNINSVFLSFFIQMEASASILPFSLNSVSWCSFHNSGKIYEVYFILTVCLGDLFHIIVWLQHHLFNQYHIDRHLGNFQSLAVRNNAAVNTFVTQIISHLYKYICRVNS